MNKKTLFFNLSIIILILVVVFFSQQPYFKSYFKEHPFLQNIIKTIYQKIREVIGNIWQKIKIVFENYILSNLQKEAEKRKENIEEELKEETEKAKQSAFQKIKDFFRVQLQKIF